MMAIHKKDWLARREEKNKERRALYEHDLEFLHQAAVAAEVLTGSEEWDKYLTTLQATLDATRELEQGCIAKILDPKCVNHEDLMAYKIVHASLTSKIETIEAVMALPKEIIEHQAAMEKRAMAKAE